MTTSNYRPLLLNEHRRRYPTSHLGLSSAALGLTTTRSRGPSESSTLTSSDAVDTPLLGRSRIGAHGRIVSASSAISESERPKAGDYDFRFPDSVFPPHFKRRHATLMSISGAVGTGLFLGTGQPLFDAGPLGILLGYIAMSSVVYGYIVSVAEMVAAYPGSRGIVGLANRFVDPALGFALGWNAWYNWALMVPTQIAAAMALLKYFDPPAWIAPLIPAMLILFVFAISSGGGRMFAEIESGFGIMKVLLIGALVVVSMIIDDSDSERNSRNMWDDWKQPFSQYLDIPGSWGRFLGFWAVFMQAAYSFFAVETPLLVAQEIRDSPNVVLRLARRSWLNITVLYIAAIAVAGTLVSRDDLKIAIDPPPDTDPTVLASPWRTSPFLIAMHMAGPGYGWLMKIVIICVICSALSAAGVETFMSARALYWMGYEHNAPRLFTKLWFKPRTRVPTGKVGKAPVPWFGLLVTFAFATLSFMCMRPHENVIGSAEKIFDFVNSMAGSAYFQSWIAVLFTYLRFWRGTVKQQKEFPDEIRRIERNRAWGQPFWAIYSLSIAILVLTFNGWSLFNPEVGNWTIYRDPTDGPFNQGFSFITSYLPIPILILLIFGYKFINQTEMVRTEYMDFSDVCDPDDPNVCPDELKEFPPEGRWAKLWWYLTAW